MEKPNKQPARVTEIWARSFRSIDDIHLRLSPLTALVGPNATGKSNILDLFRFISDALTTDLDSAISAREGIEAVRRWSDIGRPHNVEIGFVISVQGHKFEYSFSIASLKLGNYKVGWERGRLLAEDGTELFSFEAKNGKLLSPEYLTRPNRQLPLDLEMTRVERTDLVLPTIRRIMRITDRKPPYPFTVWRLLNQAYHLLRGVRTYHMFPDRLREPQRPGPPYPLSESGGNLGSVLLSMQKENSGVLTELKESLATLVPGVTDVFAERIGGYVVVSLKHRYSSVRQPMFYLAQESDGTIRLLGLLVAIYQEPPPPLIAMEEPELTIHPGALAALADLLLEASNRTQVVLTTHSPDLLDRLPVEWLRAVRAEDGATEVAEIAPHQVEAVKRKLFTTGELHRMEGLEPAPRGRG